MTCNSGTHNWIVDWKEGYWNVERAKPSDMKIASIYGFRAVPPRGGNHLHALQLMRQFQALGHQVLTWGDETVPGVQAFSRDPSGGKSLENAADVVYVRVDGNKIGDDPLLVTLLERSQKPIVWEINSPANESLAYSYLGGDRNVSPGRLPRFADKLRRRAHAWRLIPGIRREEALRVRLARRVRSAICVSRGLAFYAKVALRLQDVHVVPNGADPDTHCPVGPVADLPSEFRPHLKVLFAGSAMYPWQGLRLLEETMTLCNRAGDPVRFVLLLNDIGSRTLQTDNALVLSQVRHERVADYLRAVDVAVVIQPEFPWSRWGPYLSPMKMFEYMACGRPVVGSDCGQIAEIVQNGRDGFLFDNTAEGLRGALLLAYQGRAHLRDMGQAGRLKVERHYNWQKIAELTLEIFERACERQ